MLVMMAYHREIQKYKDINKCLLCHYHKPLFFKFFWLSSLYFVVAMVRRSTPPNILYFIFDDDYVLYYPIDSINHIHHHLMASILSMSEQHHHRQHHLAQTIAVATHWLPILQQYILMHHYRKSDTFTIDNCIRPPTVCNNNDSVKSGREEFKEMRGKGKKEKQNDFSIVLKFLLTIVLTCDSIYFSIALKLLVY